MNLTQVALFSFLTLLMTFQTGCVIALNRDLREERLFGEVLHIVPQCEKERVLVFLRVLSQVYFHPHRTNEYKVINLSNAADVKPLNIISNKENLFVNPRYKIV
ncbi:ATP-dependent RNA helicase DRS1 [Labeo rohita]|uniref:ATP-dependent RNA helicase DRS1 n=1 Tax=Labeo rohita TaxID=84645 RepID=A0ABQ8L857_LABRO|nr:ATP-dependent RNA helicase DRS1 [Labeo rohita]